MDPLQLQWVWWAFGSFPSSDSRQQTEASGHASTSMGQVNERGLHSPWHSLQSTKSAGAYSTVLGVVRQVVLLFQSSFISQCNAPNTSHLFQIGYGAAAGVACGTYANVFTVDTTGNVEAAGTMSAPALTGATITGSALTVNTITGDSITSRTFTVTNSGSAATFSGSGNQGTLGNTWQLLTNSHLTLTSQDNDDVLKVCDRSTRGKMAIIEHADRDYICYCLKVGSSSYQWTCSHWASNLSRQYWIFLHPQKLRSDRWLFWLQDKHWTVLRIPLLFFRSIYQESQGIRCGHQDIQLLLTDTRSQHVFSVE